MTFDEWWKIKCDAGYFNAEELAKHAWNSALLNAAEKFEDMDDEQDCNGDWADERNCEGHWAGEHLRRMADL